MRCVPRRAPALSSLRRDGPRVVGVGTCILQQQTAVSPEDLLASELAMVDQMARSADQQGVRLDLAILPEVSFKFARDDLGGKAETLSGPRVDAFADKARQHNTYVTVPMQLRREDGIYNSIVLLDRTGEPAGVYDKVHPVMQADGSLDFGIDPGKSFPVFDVDFGRVGVQICWGCRLSGWMAGVGQPGHRTRPVPDQPRLSHGAARVRLAARILHCRRHRSPARSGGRSFGAGDCRPVAGRRGGRCPDRPGLSGVATSNCMWDYAAREHPEYYGRIRLDWDSDAHQYLATSLDPALPIRDFLEKEKLLTGRQRIRRNNQLLAQARGGPPVMPASVERD